MAASVEELEQRLTALRARLRESRRAGDSTAGARIRKELREIEAKWEAALDAEESLQGSPAVTPPVRDEQRPPSLPGRGAVPVREQVYQSLTILGAPAAPKLISSVYEAFFSESLVATKLASLRRDEERSFTAQGYSRPYYICAAINHDRLTAARGLLAVSVWSLEQRLITPLSPRADFLRHAIGTAEQIQRLDNAGNPPSEAAWRLLRRFALTIPGAYSEALRPDPERVLSAARAEAEVHQGEGSRERIDAARRAREQLSDVQQLFGARELHDALRSGGGVL
ncbi:hypothetical protein ACFV84_09735 [Kitasatospora sp. NPDC059811]|uniref:hypothetical protein n=1 Tax=Streptomycetaceae TaxID=2062 RepID=UPI0007AF32BE|nr:hypothetical protein [Streptomyces sp. MJM8645]